MDESERQQRLLMRRVWQLNQLQYPGRDLPPRHRRVGKPWLIEEAVEYDFGTLDAYNNPKMKWTRVDFSSPRRVPRWEHYQRFRQSLEYLYWQAVEVSYEADSHRKFNVGVALLAFRPGQPPEDSWEVHLGMNTKVRPNSRPVCAEPIAISSAKAHKCSWVIGMVVVGELREEDIADGLKSLHPCHECQIFMDSERSIVTDETLIVTMKPPGEEGELGSGEIRTFKRLKQFHAKLHPDHA